LFPTAAVFVCEKCQLLYLLDLFICAENPSENAARTLKLVAKVLQMLANLVDAGPKVCTGIIRKLVHIQSNLS
jgi:hypothetical protein